jgi:hypothetical protein
LSNARRRSNQSRVEEAGGLGDDEQGRTGDEQGAEKLLAHVNHLQSMSRWLLVGRLELEAWGGLRDEERHRADCHEAVQELLAHVNHLLSGDVSRVE